jgi:hypothetical protein
MNSFMLAPAMLLNRNGDRLRSVAIAFVYHSGQLRLIEWSGQSDVGAGSSIASGFPVIAGGAKQSPARYVLRWSSPRSAKATPQGGLLTSITHRYR